MVRNTSLATILGFCLLLATSAATPVRAAEGSAKRVVSINLCADQLLMALADPEAIGGLSPYARDARLSYLADEAAGFRTGIGTAEQVVEIDPDLVIAGRFTRRATRDLLARLGYDVMLLDPARTITDSVDQIRQVAARLGVRQRGEALVAEIRAAEAEAGAQKHDRPPRAAIYQRRGYVTGAGTLSEELMALAGFANAGGALTGGRGGFVPLERLVMDPPDVLVVADATPSDEDQGAALLAHPALSELFPSDKRVVLPERLTVCAGPSLPEAIRHLATEAARVRATR